MAINWNETGRVPETAKSLARKELKTQEFQSLKTSNQEETRAKAMPILWEVEKAHCDSLCRTWENLLAGNPSSYFEIIWKNLNECTPEDRSCWYKELKALILPIAQYCSIQKMSLTAKEDKFNEIFWDTDKLKEEYSKARTYTESESREIYKSQVWKTLSWWQVSAASIDSTTQATWEVVLKTVKWKWEISEVFAANITSEQNNNIASEVAPEKEKTATQTPESAPKKASEVAQALSDFEAKNKWTENKTIAQALKKNLKIDAKTWEVTLEKPVKFSDSWELTLSPDWKSIVLKWFWYEYRYSELNGTNINHALNKVSSLTFLNNTWFTAFSPIEMWHVIGTLNSYIKITKWIPIDMEKSEWLSSAEKLELLATFKKLNIISSYDPNNLFKKITTKEAFMSNLQNLTNFYRRPWEFDTLAFEKSINTLVNDSEKMATA